MKHLFAIFPWIFVIGGLFVFYSGYRTMQARSRLATEGVASSGTIKWATSTGRTSNRIRVDYRDAAGRDWTHDFTVFSSQYRSGEPVEIIYVPADPKIIALGPHEAGETSKQSTIAMTLGTLLTLAGAILLCTRRWS